MIGVTRWGEGANICAFSGLLKPGTLNQHTLRLHTLHRVASRSSPRSKSRPHLLGIAMVTVVNTPRRVQYPSPIAVVGIYVRFQDLVSYKP